MLNKPKLLLLDEPTSGLDPIGINRLRDLLFRIERIAILGMGLVIILPTGILCLNDALSVQVLFMAAATSSDIARIPRDILVSSMFLFEELFITVSALFTIPLLIPRDEQQRTLSLFLSRSIPRWGYYFGKYIGGTAALCISFSFYAVIILVFVLVQSPALFSVAVVSWLFALLKLSLLSAIIMSSTERLFGWFGAIVAALYYIFGHVNVIFLEWSVLYMGAVGRCSEISLLYTPKPLRDQFMVAYLRRA